MIDTEKFITIQPSKVTRILGFIVALLVLAQLAAQLIKFVEWQTFLSRLLKYLSMAQIMKIIYVISQIRSYAHIFDMGLECNVPTYFSSIILLIASFLLNTIAAFKKGIANHTPFTREFWQLSFYTYQ